MVEAKNRFYFGKPLHKKVKIPFPLYGTKGIFNRKIIFDR